LSFNNNIFRAGANARRIKKGGVIMDYKALLAIGLLLGLGLTAFASALALGKAVAAAMDATGRQPEASTKILINMATGCAFIEAITIYVLVFAFVMAGKL